MNPTLHDSYSPLDPPPGPSSGDPLNPAATHPPGFTHEGETFQHYQVLRRPDSSLWELGRGAMGVTYKAFDTNLRCHVALKVISAQHLHSEVAGQRFIREARVAAKVRHPNIASVYHLGVDPQGFFYSMEFIDGETLEDLVERVGPLPLDTVLRIALQTARALAAASRQGLIHRDIKPANLMVLPQNEDGEDQLLVKVIDFGLARSYSADDSNPQLTATGFVGTPLYASPEQLEERDLDVRSDIYSLGVTLWILLTGRPPFAGKMTQVITQHLSAEPPWHYLGDIPEEARALLARMLCKNPADRFQTAGDLRAAVESCLRGLPGEESSAPGAPLPTPAPLPAWLVKTDPGQTGTVAASALANTSPLPAFRPEPRAVSLRASVAGTLSRVPGSRHVAGLIASYRRLHSWPSFVGAAVLTLGGVGAFLFWHGSLDSADATHPSASAPSRAHPALATPPAPTPSVATAPVPVAPPSTTPSPDAVSATPAPAAVALLDPHLREPGDEPVDDKPAAAPLPTAAETPTLAPAETPTPVVAATTAPTVQLAAKDTDNNNNDDDEADDSAKSSSSKKGRDSTHHTRTHHSAHRAPTPAPNLFQKIFGIKPKPQNR